MQSYMISNGVIICGNTVKFADGTVLPPCPGKGNNITTINGKIYINGYEFKRGKWRRTIKAIYHMIF